MIQHGVLWTYMAMAIVQTIMAMIMVMLMVMAMGMMSVMVKLQYVSAQTFPRNAIILYCSSGMCCSPSVCSCTYDDVLRAVSPSWRDAALGIPWFRGSWHVDRTQDFCDVHNIASQTDYRLITESSASSRSRVRIRACVRYMGTRAHHALATSEMPVYTTPYHAIPCYEM